VFPFRFLHVTRNVFSSINAVDWDLWLSVVQSLYL
jgi:hypothetical protein